MTDIHFGHGFGAVETAFLSRLVARQKPDIVLLGGDLAHTPRTDLTDFFSQRSPGCPTLFAPGNHDMEDAAAAGDVMAQVRAAGLTVLCNSTEVWRGLTFVGFPSALHAERRHTLLATGGLKIVLGHEPDVWDYDPGSDFVHLAGHTHGGQVRLFGRPLLLPTLGRKYPQGEFAGAPDRRLLVSSGVGCTGARVRINCPPEIIKLKFV